MTKETELTIEILQEALTTLKLLNEKIAKSLYIGNCKTIPSLTLSKKANERWVTINEYLADQGLSWYDKSQRTSLGLRIKQEMDIKGLKPIKSGKSNRYPQSMIHEAIR